MLNDETITAALVDESVVINGESTVVTPDVTADNGIVHVVDTVLLPSWLTNSIVDRAVSTEDLSSLVDLVTAAGLVETLAGPGPFTVFAPTNDAVAEAVAVLSEALGTTDIPPELLTGVLTYHVVPGIYSAGAITEGLTLPTVQGEELTFSLEGGASVNGNSISATDILANNGIVHIIDGVLLPPSIAATLPTTAPAPVAPEAPVDGPTMAPVESETTPAPTMMEDMDTEVPSSAVSRSVAASAFAAAAAVVLAF
jgi:transforming growth factor-beta-induced protein